MGLPINIVLTDLITLLDRYPNAQGGLTYQELQAYFDGNSIDIKDTVNLLLDVLASVVDGDSGADAIGATAVSGLTGATIQALIESLKTFVDDGIADLEGVGRTTETIKDNADDLATHKTSDDHDGRYYTETESDNLLDAKANQATTYTKTEVYTQTESDNLLDAKADKDNVLEKDNTTSFTPTADYHPATKKFVDDTAFDGVGDGSLTDVKMATDYKLGGLSNLDTTEQSSYTGAINEVNTIVGTNASDIDDIETKTDFITVTQAVDLDTMKSDTNQIKISNLATGTSDAILLDTDGTFDLTLDGNVLPLTPSLTNTTAVTIAVDSQTAKDVKKFDVDTDAFVALEADDIKKNTPIQLAWSVGNDFFIFAPKGGADNNIQSIQRGLTAIPDADSGESITITNVDITKSIVMARVAYANIDTLQIRQYDAIGYLYNGTTLKLARQYGGVGTSNDIFVEWQVIEYKNVKSLQSGTITSAGTLTNQAINSVDLSKSLLFYSYKSISSGTSPLGRFICGATLTSATNIQVRSMYSASKNVQWYVVEFE